MAINHLVIGMILQVIPTPPKHQKEVKVISGIKESVGSNPTIYPVYRWNNPLILQRDVRL